MNKREFLALSGAVPLMLAGCGGDGGSASVRLVNASVGYPTGLGFMDDSVQAVTGIDYGDSSAFLAVKAGTEPIALTVTSGSSTVSLFSSTRTLNKDSRYSLVAYGFADELRAVPLVENAAAPDSGYAKVNVFNTSVDIGAVDVYISPGTSLDLGTVIASSASGLMQTAFASVAAGSYYITVVGANSIAKGVSDVRFQSSAAVKVVDQQIMTIILTPGASGVLANAIYLTQGTGTATGTVSEQNSTYRLRVFANTGTGSTVTVTDVLTSEGSPAKSEYTVLDATSTPTVTVTGVANAGSVAVTGATLAPGSDYTLLVYVDQTGNAVAHLVLDDNTAPVSASGVKFRLINLDPGASTVSMTVNGTSTGTNVAYGAAGAYKEVVTPQSTDSVVNVSAQAAALVTHELVLVAGNIFTEVVIGTGTDFFVASSVS
jgi:hypothetical protein